MMQKVVSHFLGLLLIVGISACSSLPSLNQDHVDLPTENSHFFVDPSIARYMEARDRIVLQRLIATAQPQQVVKWHSRTAYTRFEFTSLGIYINTQGQGCRNYRVALHRGLFMHRSFNYTACRDSQGDWQITIAA